MILQKISISRVEYGEDQGRYRGSLQFLGTYGQIVLSLNPETSAKVLAVVADMAVASGKEIAQQLTADIFNQPAIEGPRND